MEVLEWSTLQKQITLSPPHPRPSSILLNDAAYWKSSYTEACAKKFFQILENSIIYWGEGLGLKF